MKFKTIILTLLLGLKLIASEILTPQEALSKLDEYKQINGAPLDLTYDYAFENTIKPSFKCTKKFKKYSLEDFICNSNFNAFRDNYFASLYNIIIKENPKLKDKALKIARERIKETKNGCLIYTKKQYDSSFKPIVELEDNLNTYVSETIKCISNTYRAYATKLALMLYDNDKRLFKKIFGNDYEKFKEAFDDTLKVSIKGYEKDYGKNFEQFREKYGKIYYYEYIVQSPAYYYDLIYTLSIQHNLIDSTGKFK